jgi:hypothetical protein
MIGDLVLEKLVWYESRPVQVFLWVTFTAVFLAAGWSRRGPPHRHEALLPEGPLAPHWPLSLARLAAALHFVFIVALVVVLTTLSRGGSPSILYEIPPYVFLILLLPLAAGALSLAAAMGLVPVWRAGPSARVQRLYLALVVAFLIAFLPFLWHWNLLGFRV